MKKATENQNGLYHAFRMTEPPQGLCAAILARIDLAKRRAAKLRAGAFACATLFSAVLLVPVVEYTLSQFYASGFYDYLSLAMSDQTLAVTYWREFGLSLLESLPSLALLLLLPITLALVWSLIRLIKNVRTGFAYVRLI